MQHLIRVFISYNRSHAGWMARALCSALPKVIPCDVYLDTTSAAIGELSTVILNEIPKHTHFCMVLTPAALKRYRDRSSWVRKEYDEAKKACPPHAILPLYDGKPKNCLKALEKFDPPFASELESFNILSLRRDSFDQDIITIRERLSWKPNPSQPAVVDARGPSPSPVPQVIYPTQSTLRSPVTLTINPHLSAADRDLVVNCIAAETYLLRHEIDACTLAADEYNKVLRALIKIFGEERCPSPQTTS